MRSGNVILCIWGQDRDDAEVGDILFFGEVLYAKNIKILNVLGEDFTSFTAFIT